MASLPQIFDRKLLAIRKFRAIPISPNHDFLLKISADTIAERLNACHIPPAQILNLGSHGYDLSSKLTLPLDLLINTELNHDATHIQLVMDDELLAFAENSFDVVVSLLNFQFINDLPGVLSQIRHVLKPGGMLLASFFGERTLSELRSAMFETDLAIFNAVSPHIIPFIDIKTMGQLLLRTGFNMPVVDSEQYTISYPTLGNLITELRGMSATNILLERGRCYLGKRYLQKLNQHYIEQFSEAGGDITATFELLTMFGVK